MMMVRQCLLLGIFALSIGNAEQYFARCRGPQLPGCTKRTRLAVRGGDASGNPRSPYQLNPQYVPNVMTMQHLENDQQFSQDHHYQQQQQQQYEASFQFRSTFADPHQRNAPRTLSDSIRFFFTNLYHISPSLFMTLTSCLAIFCCWQTPMFQRSVLARTYFICNKQRRRRGQTTTNVVSLILAAVSHSGALHLLLNLSALLSFGIPVKQMLKQESAMIVLLLGAAVVGNVFFLLLDRNHGGGAMGLSGVTCALLAVYCRWHPNQQLGMLVAGIFPVRLQASTLLNSMIVTSVLGTFVPSIKSSIAHAAHLGGLLYGMAYYEAWRRRHVLTRTINAIWKKRVFMKI